jgi:tRNA-specific 2-thiouridylase
MDTEYMATGHYARTKYYHSTYHLLKGVDNDKDQSYMLYTMTQTKLARLLLPLGDYTKSQVRQLAQEIGLHIANKRSSQDICFATPNYGSLLSDHPTTVPGEITDTDGKIIGKHRGAAFYTVGQRHGLGLAAIQPLYVVKIEPWANSIMVGSHNDLLVSSLVAVNTNWISGINPKQPLELNAGIRYRSPETTCIVTAEPDSAKVQFQKPQIAVAPGQAVVFYHGKEVIGGGTIQVTQTIHQN